MSKSAPDTSAPVDDVLPDAAAIEAMLAPVRGFAAEPESARVRVFLQRLAGASPQVLLLEGGRAESRLAAAHYWMALLNCERQELPVPCLECAVCRAMVSHLHRDCFFFDGTAGSIKIDEVRALRSVLGEPPRETRYRIVLFREAQALGEAAANSLLKSFEDPRPGTSFILLAPQRERLLPTLVSRSVVLTLPWPLEEDAAAREEFAPWEAVLCTFLQSGREFFERSGSKGAVDADVAHALINMCRRSMLGCIKARQEGTAPREGLESILARLPDMRLRMLDEGLAECQDSLLYGVNPALVVEWLVTRMYLLLPRNRA